MGGPQRSPCRSLARSAAHMLRLLRYAVCRLSRNWLRGDEISAAFMSNFSSDNRLTRCMPASVQRKLAGIARKDGLRGQRAAAAQRKEAGSGEDRRSRALHRVLGASAFGCPAQCSPKLLRMPQDGVHQRISGALRCPRCEANASSKRCRF